MYSTEVGSNLIPLSSPSINSQVKKRVEAIYDIQKSIIDLEAQLMRLQQELDEETQSLCNVMESKCPRLFGHTFYLDEESSITFSVKTNWYKMNPEERVSFNQVLELPE